MTVIKVKIIWLILSVENLFSMKTVNSAQLVLWGLEEFWERRLDGKSKEEMTRLLSGGSADKRVEDT